MVEYCLEKVNPKSYQNIAGNLHPVSLGREPNRHLDLSGGEWNPGLQCDRLGY